MVVNLSSQCEELIEMMLKQRRFATAQDAMECAIANLHVLLKTEDEYEYPNLREQIEEGIAAMKAGEFVDGETFFKQLMSDVEERVGKSKLPKTDTNK